MSVTALLFAILMFAALGIAIAKILDSRVVRMLLISNKIHKEEIEIEREAQKTRTRFLDEIKNPDRILETIIKMQRGEEVQIPLAAFDYIYRNLNKFTLVDKEGRITIVNQDDYFKFKEKALEILKLSEDTREDIKQILENIEKVEAETPIEITEHSDGTIVKVDHIERTVEITKPNQEKIFIDHKRDTVITQKAIKQDEQQKSTSKIDFIRNEQKMKNLQDENTLLKAKQQRLQKTKNEDAQVTFEDIDAFITKPKNVKDDDLIQPKKPIETFSSNVSLNTVVASNPPVEQTHEHALIHFTDIASFLSEAITFATVSKLLNHICTKQHVNNAYKAYIQTCDLEHVKSTINTVLSENNTLYNSSKDVFNMHSLSFALNTSYNADKTRVKDVNDKTRRKEHIESLSKALQNVDDAMLITCLDVVNVNSGNLSFQ